MSMSSRDWFETNSRRKNVILKAAIRGCRGLLGRVVLAYLKTRKSNPQENSGLHHSEKRNKVIPLLHCVMNKMK